jgi:hypothetical protein
MELPSVLQGRPFGANELAEIRALLAEIPPLSRYQLSRRLARQWEWRTATGQLKDMAARTLLRKLQERGWIGLPAPRMKSPTRSGRAPAWPHQRGIEERPVACSLACVRPLRIEEVSRWGRQAERAELECCVERYHYLGYRSRVGQNLQYWVRSSQGDRLGCVVFGAAAWQCAVRDAWIGWNRRQRAERLHRIVNNTRFLIFPWVRVPHLASHVLGLIGRRIGADWRAKYAQPIELMETFVDRQRFAGSSYRAANWIGLGPTKGRGRQGAQEGATTIKEVYVCPLDRRFRQHLTGSEVPS